MDVSQLYCGLIIGVLIFVFLKSLFNDKTDDRNKKTTRDKDRRSSCFRIEPVEDDQPVVKCWEMPHDVEELRHLTVTELQNFNIQYGKMTDRYWREIFRRQNDDNHPDHINVSRLQTANIITVLDEHIPHGSLHELTIAGLVPKPISSRKCEVMRYLRDRINMTRNFELIFERDKIQIVQVT